MSPTTRKELLRDYIAGKTDHWLSWDAIDRIMAIVRDSDGTATAAVCEDIPVPQDCQARAVRHRP